MFKDLPIDGVPDAGVTLSDFLGRDIVFMAEGRSEVRFLIPDVFINLQGVLHGGAYATMLDTACGVAIRGAIDMEKYGGHSTLELKTSYLKAGLPGAYTAKGQVTRMGKSIAFVEADLFNSEDDLVGRASATFKLRQRRTGEK